MYSNYLKIAFRKLLQNKTWSVITIFSMALGIACCLMITAYISHELSYDNFHPNGNRTFRVILGGGHYGPEQLAPYLVENFPEIEQVVRIVEGSRGLKLFGVNNFYSYEENFCHAEPVFFQMFGFALELGDPNTALANPNSIVISKKIAKKYFGDENPLGKTLNLEKKTDFIVTGVFKELNTPSHLKIDLLTKFTEEGFKKWYFFSCITYATLKQGVDLENFQNKVLATYSEFTKKENTGYLPGSIEFQPISHINILPATDSENLKGDPKLQLGLLAAVALIILILACLNYVNLSVAELLTRSREVGVRKIVGANQSQLIRQSIVESILIVITASLLALLIMEFAQPLFNNLTGKTIQFQNLQRLSVLVIGFSVILLTVIVAAIYIAVMFAAANPAEILKNNLHKGAKGMRLKRGLVGFQFVATIVLVTVSIIIMKQLHFLSTKNLGFDKENILVIDDHLDVSDDHAEALKNEIKKVPGVINAAFGQLPYSREKDSMFEVPYFNAINGDIRLRELEVGFDYLETLNIKLIEGRSFSMEHATDFSGNSILINQAAVKQFGWDNPVGNSYKMGKDSYKVIGVFEDIHQGSLYEFIWPTLLEFDEVNCNLLVRIKPGNLKSTIKNLEKVWRQFAPHAPMDFFFLDDEIDAIYQNEKRMSSFLLIFTALTLLIACSGLYGMISYIANQRTKEIGIRKVLGASLFQMISLLVKEFCLVVLASAVIATPIAFYLMNQWLKNFAYRIEMSWWMFVLAGSLALLIALATVSWQAFQAASANPVEALRYE